MENTHNERIEINSVQIDSVRIYWTGLLIDERRFTGRGGINFIHVYKASFSLYIGWWKANNFFQQSFAFSSLCCKTCERWNHIRGFFSPKNLHTSFGFQNEYTLPTLCPLITFAGVAPSDCKVLLTEAPMNSRANRERIVDVMFQKFGFSHPGHYLRITWRYLGETVCESIISV